MSTLDLTVDQPQQKTVKEFIPTKVVVKPVPVQSFRLGLEQTKEGYLKLPGTSYVWEPSRRGNTYMTGLERVDAKEIARLEKELGKKLDNSFYEELSFRMDGSSAYGIQLDLTIAFEKVVYLAMLGSHLIAPSAAALKDGSKPQAEWYIEDKEAEAEADASERDKTIKAISEYGNLSDHKKRAFCKVFNINVTGLSPKATDNLLWKKINEKGVAGKKAVEKFLEMCKWSDEKVNVYEEVEDAISGNILRRNSAQDWLYGDEVIGANKEQIISKLLLTEHNGLRMSIKSKLALRK